MTLCIREINILQEYGVRMSNDVTAPFDSKQRRVEEGLIPEPTLRSVGLPRASVAERMALYHVPGMSVAVIADGRIEWAAGYGRLEPEGGRPVDEHTLFQACSISKPVTTLAVLSLVQAGVLDLDRDVNEYLRSWSVPANGDWQPVVTLRALLSHAAGTTVHGFPGYRRGDHVPTLLQVLDGEPPANTRPVCVNAAPGLGFRYSGGGICIVQQVLSDATGSAFPDLMRELVLSSLGMDDSTFEQPLPESRWADAALGCTSDGAAVAGGWHTHPEAAAAGLWTTPSDLARVALEVQRTRRDGSGAVLTQESVNAMLERQNDGPVGLGFFVVGSDGHLHFMHGGDNVGYKCELVAFADHGLGMVVMTNGDEGWQLCMETTRAIAHEYEWPLPVTATQQYYSYRRSPVQLHREVYRSYTGEFELRPGLSAVVELEDDDLTITFPGQPTIPLCAQTSGEYYAEVVDLEAAFSRDEMGAVAGVTLRQGGLQFVASKIA